MVTNCPCNQIVPKLQKTVKDNMIFFLKTPKQMAEVLIKQDRDYAVEVAKAILNFDEIDSRELEERDYAPEWMKNEISSFFNHEGHIECDKQSCKL